MRFHRLDLNLLIALRALLEEQSVRLASERLNLSQSATSSALGRLRDYFEDDLLELKGRNLVLTARGQELLDPVRAILDQIQATMAVKQPFDPGVSDRRLSVLASDYAIEVMLGPAMAAFEEEAPHMVFEVKALGDEVVEELRRGRADLLLALDSVISTDMPFTELWTDDFVVVCWSGNRALRQGISRAEYEEMHHVVTRFGWTRVPSFEEWALKSQSVKRQVEVVAPSFTAVPSFLVGTQRIATMHRKLAERMARSLPLRILECPMDIPGIRVTAQWTPNGSNDPALMWLVGRLRAYAGQI
ncbi:MAG TPA: LysR family transcriptional regulator [Novosphingobium sp.]|nr:LysR family transcriptional regulator [Novosphingobium sp.]HZV10830.1 LysR family transcriptional regulator [Novosphingobium sp.]